MSGFIGVPGNIETTKGGFEPDVYMLNDSAIERWPCGAHIITLLAVGIHDVNPLRIETLARHMPATHHSHTASQPSSEDDENCPTHSERLHRVPGSTRYLKLFTHERGDRPRKEIVHVQPMSLHGSKKTERKEQHEHTALEGKATDRCISELLTP
jgi:hypothetical protein